MRLIAICSLIITSVASMDSTVLGRRRGDEIAATVVKQVKTGLKGASAALTLGLKARYAWDSDSSEDEDYYGQYKLGPSFEPPVLVKRALAAAVVFTVAAELPPFKIPHFRSPNVQRDRPG